MSTVIHYEIESWMMKIEPVNTADKFYLLGNVKGSDHTQLVTKIGGDGGAMMYCKTHRFVYPIKGSCAECQNAVHELPNE